MQSQTRDTVRSFEGLAGVSVSQLMNDLPAMVFQESAARVVPAFATRPYVDKHAWTDCRQQRPSCAPRRAPYPAGLSTVDREQAVSNEQRLWHMTYRRSRKSRRFRNWSCTKWRRQHHSFGSNKQVTDESVRGLRNDAAIGSSVVSIRGNQVCVGACAPVTGIGASTCGRWWCATG